MTDLVDRLQIILGESYRLAREIGGGGMSRVFLAEEIRLGRQVVIKVLPPEMAAGVNIDRFEREIQVAARLQHPHIVPLLTAGAEGDLLYYIMPFIEGESLRTRLQREVELPVHTTGKILREVVDALEYAHAEGVIHRDIKPDNVMLSRGHALITDFGVSKAVSASSGGHSSLTSLGVALGTPAYMSPEQAAADPHVDHRADLYAVGAMAYELLAGRPPFTGATPQQVLAAHVSQEPEPILSLRDTIPAGLAGLVMRCLEKRAADRYQTAGEMRTVLDAVVTPSGGVTPTGTQPVPAVHTSAVQRAAARGHPVRVATLFGGAAAAVLMLVYLIVLVVGLPDWVFVGAVALLAVGLPVILVTGHHERRRAVATLAGMHVSTPTGMERHFTWRKALLGGGLAFGLLILGTATYMAARAFGIGPAGTLMASGVMGDRERVILASFDNRTTDSTLGSTVTELLRISISQSPVVTLLDPARITEGLTRMQRDAATHVDGAVAMEMAERDGIKAVITGKVVPLGSGFVLSAQLVSAGGEVLTAQQASARDEAGLIAAVDELAGKLRERIGESLRSIRRTVPLDQVTTGSMTALRRYSQALNAEIAGDQDRALQLLEEAITEDSVFAMAFRKIGVILQNNFEQRSRAIDAVTRAYTNRDRLTARERGYATAQYHSTVTGERENALAAYRTILEQYPDDFRALNNSGVLYSDLGDIERAGEYYERALSADSTWTAVYTNLAYTQRVRGLYDEAASTLDAATERFPENPGVLQGKAGLAHSQGDYDTAERLTAILLEEQRASPQWQATGYQYLTQSAMTQGKVQEARGRRANARAAAGRRGLPAEQLRIAIEGATAELMLTGRLDPSIDTLDAGSLETLAAADRPYEELILYRVEAGNLEHADGLAAAMEGAVGDWGRSFQRQISRSKGRLALGRGDEERGLEFMRGGISDGCIPCDMVDMADAFDRAGMTDSAFVYWERYVQGGYRFPFLDQVYLPATYRRLGELHEQSNEVEQAVDYYSRFVDLWENADAELQPLVQDIRGRIARLVGETSGRR